MTGLRLEALTHRRPAASTGRAAAGSGTWGISEIEVFVKKPDGKDWEKLKLVNATADFSEPEQKPTEGRKASGPVAIPDRRHGRNDLERRSRHRSPQSAVGGRRAVREAARAAGGHAAQDRLADDRHAGLLPLEHRRRIANSRGAAGEPRGDAGAADAAPQRTPEQQAAVFRRLARQPRRLRKPINDEIDALWKQYPQAATSILHLAEREPQSRRADALA